MSQRFRVAVVSAEAVPFAKVGGLADVVGALSRAVAELGASVAVILPRYAGLALPQGASLELAATVDVPVGGTDRRALIYRLEGGGKTPHLAHYFIANDGYFDRPGIYDDPATGEAYGDNAERFIFFARAALEALRALAYAPEVIHVNDHQTALIPAYLKTLYAEDPFFQMSASVLSIHNMGYQGVYPPGAMGLAGFPGDFFYPLSPFEFWGQMNFLKAGIHFADVITTVSERYAEEIQSGEEFGFGLQGALNARRVDLVGILNGLDVRTWNPRTDRLLPARYDAGSLEAKGICKSALLEECGLPPAPDWPVFGMITRLVDQKGLDLLELAADRLFAAPARWVILGSGLRRYEEMLERLAREHPDRVAFRKGFNDPLAHRIEAGADFFLMPSRYEPCGLNQMMSMRYGTVPVVRETGGLADTVVPWNPERPPAVEGTEASGEGAPPTGVTFREYSPEALLSAVDQALRLYRDRRMLREIRRNGMARDFSWQASARKYVQLYRQANAARRMGTGFNRWLEAVQAERVGRP
ncbi:MAG TPA: glycogen/starch synthase [Candidatus Eisenbacteria bacterium]|jgi:starch synthase